jgi:hypothetical protein
MTTTASLGIPDRGFLGPLQAVALIAVLAGAVGSIGFMLRAGRHNSSRLLLVLFTVWVLSPFAVLLSAYAVSKRWSILTRRALYSVGLLIAVGPLGIYGEVALGPPRAHTASAFVVVPPASWLLIAMTVAIAAWISGKRSRRGDGA